MADKDLKVLSGRLKSLKGWLSRTVPACDNLVSAPRSLASDSFLKSRLEKSIQELDDRLQQIYDCVGELEASELTRPFDDKRKEREESYASSSAQAASNVSTGCLRPCLS